MKQEILWFLGCIRNGIDEASANKIFDEMAEFAKYAFNKSPAEVKISVNDTKIITPAENPSPRERTFILFLFTKKVINPPKTVANPAIAVIKRGIFQLIILLS